MNPDPNVQRSASICIGSTLSIPRLKAVADTLLYFSIFHCFQLLKEPGAARSPEWTMAGAKCHKYYIRIPRIRMLPHGTTCTCRIHLGPVSSLNSDKRSSWNCFVMHTKKVCFSSTLRNGAYVAAHATSCNVMQRDAAHGPMWSHVVPCGPMSQSRLSLCATQQLGRDESNVPSNTLLLLFLLPGSQHVMGGTCKIGIYLNGMAATNHSQADCFFRISIF